MGVKLYIGQKDDNEKIFKIGYTERHCYERHNYTDFTIFGAYEFEKITLQEALFLESYLRLAFIWMEEIERGIRQDYFLLKDDIIHTYPTGEKEVDTRKWIYKWFEKFLLEGIEIINAKRAFTTFFPPMKIKRRYYGEAYWY